MARTRHSPTAGTARESTSLLSSGVPRQPSGVRQESLSDRRSRESSSLLQSSRASLGSCSAIDGDTGIDHVNDESDDNSDDKAPHVIVGRTRVVLVVLGQALLILFFCKSHIGLLSCTAPASCICRPTSLYLTRPVSSKSHQYRRHHHCAERHCHRSRRLYIYSMVHVHRPDARCGIHASCIASCRHLFPNRARPPYHVRPRSWYACLGACAVVGRLSRWPRAGRNSLRRDPDAGYDPRSATERKEEKRSMDRLVI